MRNSKACPTQDVGAISSAGSAVLCLRRFIPRQLRDKIGLPGFPAVFRKSLFKFVRIWRDVRPNGPDQDGFAIERVLTEEFATAVFEFPNFRVAERTVLAGSEGLAPLMSLRVVEKQGQ